MHKEQAPVFRLKPEDWSLFFVQLQLYKVCLLLSLSLASICGNPRWWPASLRSTEGLARVSGPTCCCWSVAVRGTKTLGDFLEIGVRCTRLKTSKNTSKRIIRRKPPIDQASNYE